MTVTPLQLTGRVYFVTDGEAIKIGWTASEQGVISRMRDLQVGNCRRLRLLGSVAGEVADERELHRRLHKAAISGEWFALPAEEALPEIERLISLHADPADLGAALVDLYKSYLRDSRARLHVIALAVRRDRLAREITRLRSQRRALSDELAELRYQLGAGAEDIMLEERSRQLRDELDRVSRRVEKRQRRSKL